MTDLELVNAFLAREDLSEAEEVIRNKCLTLDQRLNMSRQELQTAAEEHQRKQAEVVALSQQLEGVVQVVLELAKKALVVDEPVAEEPAVEYEAPAE